MAAPLPSVSLQGDFGLSKIVDEQDTMKTVCGTPGYCGEREGRAGGGGRETRAGCSLPEAVHSSVQGWQTAAPGSGGAAGTREVFPPP